MIPDDEYEAFIAAIRATPDDDAPRLRLADRLDDDGQYERAELVRVQCELWRHGPTVYRLQPGESLMLTGTMTLTGEVARHPRIVGNSTDTVMELNHIGDDITELVARKRELLYNHAGEMFAMPFAKRYGRVEVPTMPAGVTWHGTPAFGRRSTWGWMLPDYSTFILAEPTRGFIEEVECSADSWIRHASAILSRHPVRSVTLTTWPDIEQRSTGEMRLKGCETWHVANLPLTYDGALNLHDELLRQEWPGIEFELPVPLRARYLTTLAHVPNELLNTSPVDMLLQVRDDVRQWAEANAPELQRAGILMGEAMAKAAVAVEQFGGVVAEAVAAAPPARQTGSQRARSIEFIGRHRRPRR